MVDGRWWMAAELKEVDRPAPRADARSAPLRSRLGNERGSRWLMVDGGWLSTIGYRLSTIDLFLEGCQGAAVGHEIGGGGGAESAETIDQAEHEKDERLVGGGEG